jgi:hypothetical protein
MPQLHRRRLLHLEEAAATAATKRGCTCTYSQHKKGRTYTYSQHMKGPHLAIHKGKGQQTGRQAVAEKHPWQLELSTAEEAAGWKVNLSKHKGQLHRKYQ